MNCTPQDFLRCALYNRVPAEESPCRIILMSASAELFDAYKSGLMTTYRICDVAPVRQESYLIYRNARVYRGSPQNRWSVDVHLID